jgi:hypothetical protein
MKRSCQKHVKVRDGLTILLFYRMLLKAGSEANHTSFITNLLLGNQVDKQKTNNNFVIRVQMTLQIPQPITFSIKQLIFINARNRRVWVNIVFPSHYFRFDSLLGYLIFPFSLSFLSILITFLL